jgi:hypothetical protein
MTDNKSMFSSLAPCRRRIKVGGGSIYSTEKGTVKLVIDNRSVFLEDALLVPGLGCTLVSAKKLLGSELIGNFDNHAMQFRRKSDKELMLEARMINGLYIVSHISTAADGRRFTTADNNLRTALQAKEFTSSPEQDTESEPEEDIIEADAEIERLDTSQHPRISKVERNRVARQIRSAALQEPRIPRIMASFTLKEKRLQRELARYVHYHRRFCHAGPEALSLLHTVSNIKKIVIPEQIPICETCARQKIHKRQSKKLAEHKQEPLALISFDVAGPFPKSYRGYRYFGEIIDN